MKKLLALLLCVVLLASIVPTAAFAAVDLKPAYDALESLKEAYGQLGAVVAGKINIDMIEELYDLYMPRIIEMVLKLKSVDDDIKQEGIAAYIAFCKEVKGNIDDDVLYYVENFTDFYPSGISYEKLFDEFGPLFYGAYDWAGEEFIINGTLDMALFLANDDVDAAIESIRSDFAS